MKRFNKFWPIALLLISVAGSGNMTLHGYFFAEPGTGSALPMSITLIVVLYLLCTTVFSDIVKCWNDDTDFDAKLPVNDARLSSKSIPLLCLITPIFLWWLYMQCSAMYTVMTVIVPRHHPLIPGILPYAGFVVVVILALATGAIIASKSDCEQHNYAQI